MTVAITFCYNMVARLAKLVEVYVSIQQKGAVKNADFTSSKNRKRLEGDKLRSGSPWLSWAPRCAAICMTRGVLRSRYRQIFVSPRLRVKANHRLKTIEKQPKTQKVQQRFYAFDGLERPGSPMLKLI
jgi:hypothetical protein